MCTEHIIGEQFYNEAMNYYVFGKNILFVSKYVPKQYVYIASCKLLYSTYR